MATTETRGHGDANPTELSKDELFHLLSNQRRRDTLQYLDDNNAPVNMRDIAEWIAAKENDTEISQLRSEERQRVYVALYQLHLPKLDARGVIEYNQSRGIVRRTALADYLDPYIDVEMNAITAEQPVTTNPAADRLDYSSIQRGLGVTSVGVGTLSLSWLGMISPTFLLVLTWVGLVAVCSRPHFAGLMAATYSAKQ